VAHVYFNKFPITGVFHSSFMKMKAENKF